MDRFKQWFQTKVATPSKATLLSIRPFTRRKMTCVHDAANQRNLKGGSAFMWQYIVNMGSRIIEPMRTHDVGLGAWEGLHHQRNGTHQTRSFCGSWLVLRFMSPSW